MTREEKVGIMITANTGSTSRTAFILCGIVIGYGLAQFGGIPAHVQAEVRETTPRAAFQAGSERSETILKEIAATLKTMDGRLERLEKVAVDRKLP